MQNLVALLLPQKRHCSSFLCTKYKDLFWTGLQCRNNMSEKSLLVEITANSKARKQGKSTRRGGRTKSSMERWAGWPQQLLKLLKRSTVLVEPTLRATSWHDHGFCREPRHITGWKKVLRDQILARAAMCSHVLQWLSPLQIYGCQFYHSKTETRKLHSIENLGILYPHLHKNTCKTCQFSTVQPHEDKLQTCTCIHIYAQREVSFKVHEKRIKWAWLYMAAQLVCNNS